MNNILIVLTICTVAALILKSMGKIKPHIYTHLYMANKTIKQTNNKRTNIPYNYTRFHEENKTLKQTNNVRTNIPHNYTRFHEVKKKVKQSNNTRTSIPNTSNYTNFREVNKTLKQKMVNTSINIPYNSTRFHEVLVNKTVDQKGNMRTSIPYNYRRFNDVNRTVKPKDDFDARRKKTVKQKYDHDERQAKVCSPISKVLNEKVRPDPNIREATCNCCFQHNFDYLINNRNICKTKGPNQVIDLFIMIFTQHINFKVRQAIRETWLTASKSNTANVRYVFLLGKVTSVKLSKDIAQENDLYKDILKEDFIDTYENQTLKTIMGFKWIVNYCRAAKNVLKTDDDTFINVPNILKYIRNSGKKLRTKMVGSCKNAEPNRNASSKWYVSIKDYKETMYPGFCSGIGYLTSFIMIEKIYEISPYVPFIWLEDIYVSLCFRKVGGTVENVLGYHIFRPDFDPCFFKGDNLFISHEFTRELMRKIWKAKC